MLINFIFQKHNLDPKMPLSLAKFFKNKSYKISMFIFTYICLHMYVVFFYFQVVLPKLICKEFYIISLKNIKYKGILSEIQKLRQMFFEFI